MIGQRFGRSVVIGPAEPDPSGMLRAMARCDCGRERPVRIAYLKRNKHTKCIRCAAQENGLKQRGKVAHNRLPRAGGAFNDLFGRYQKGASHRGISFDLTKDAFAEITRMNCHFCGSPPRAEWKCRKGMAEPYIYNGIDRLNPREGYAVGNIAPCCSVCNYMKQDMTAEEFLR